MPRPFTPFRSIPATMPWGPAHRRTESSVLEPVTYAEHPGCGHPCSHPGCRNHTSHPCEVCGQLSEATDRLRQTQERNVRCGMPDDATTAILRRLNEDMERWITELRKLLED